MGMLRCAFHTVHFNKRESNAWSVEERETVDERTPGKRARGNEKGVVG